MPESAREKSPFERSVFRIALALGGLVFIAMATDGFTFSYERSSGWIQNTPITDSIFGLILGGLVFAVFYGVVVGAHLIVADAGRVVRKAGEPSTPGGMIEDSVKSLRTRTNIGVGFGFLLQLIGDALWRSRPDSVLGPVVLLVSVFLLIWGCASYSASKGWSRWWGLLGSLSLIGFVLLVFMPNRRRAEG